MYIIIHAVFKYAGYPFLFVKRNPKNEVIEKLSIN